MAEKNLCFGEGRFLQKNLGFGVGFGYRNNTSNKQKSLLTESVLTTLSHIEINGDAAGTRKKSVLNEYLL